MGRTYSDEEVRTILPRAVESRGETDRAGTEGLSIEQLRAAALEAGIDPARVDAAAASLVDADPAPVSLLAGMPTTVGFRSVVVGVRLDDDSANDVLAVIREVTGRVGTVTSEFGSVEWTSRDGPGGRHVSLTPGPDGVRVQVVGNYRDVLGLTYAGVGFVGATVAGILFDGAGLGALLPAFGVAAAALIPPRFVYRSWRRREDPRMREVFDRVVGLLASRVVIEPDEEDGQEEPEDGS